MNLPPVVVDVQTIAVGVFLGTLAAEYASWLIRDVVAFYRKRYSKRR